jgi:hypothetical protein
MSDALKLSAVLIIANQRERARLSLKSLLEQTRIAEMEIVLLDCSTEGTPPLPGSDHSLVRTIRLKPGLTAGWVRAEGIRQTRAPLLVFLEEHARAAPDWADVILKSFEGDWTGVGPELANGNPGSGISSEIEIMYYPIWSPPAAGGSSFGTPLHNTAYRREVLLSYEPLLEVLIFPESLLQRRLVRDGHKLLLEPRMKITHFYETELHLIAPGDFQAHRAFGALSPLVFPRPLWRRILRLLVLPLVPWRRIAKLLWLVGRKRPAKFGRTMQSLLVIFVLHHAAIFGEFTGTLFGIGNSSEFFLDYQLNAHRNIPGLQD